MVVAQQLGPTAELQLTHVAGQQPHADVGQGVGEPSGAVCDRGPAEAAEAQVSQVGEGVASDHLWVRLQGRQAGFAGEKVRVGLRVGGQ